jgi:hypothetical protein
LFGENGISIPYARRDIHIVGNLPATALIPEPGSAVRTAGEVAGNAPGDAAGTALAGNVGVS